MEDQLISVEPTDCTFCAQSVPSTNIFCAHCGYPENGSETDRKYYFSKRFRQKRDNEEALRKIKSARNTLYIMAGIILISGLFMFSRDGDKLELITNFVLTGLYIGLAISSTKKPFMALLLGLFLYVTLIVISVTIDISNLYRGLILKVIILAFLIKGLQSAMMIMKQYQPLVEKKEIV